VLSEKAIIALTEDVPSPESFKEREQALSKCIAKLPSKLRDLLWRRYSRRQTSDEMAEALGMTSNAVRVALSRSRMSLRDCINLQLKEIKGI
jgi:RNA polymerase sigma-70 factor (ECF subfamily)